MHDGGAGGLQHCGSMCLHDGDMPCSLSTISYITSLARQTLNTGSLAWATAAAVAYLYMVRPWVERLVHLPYCLYKVKMFRIVRQT